MKVRRPSLSRAWSSARADADTVGEPPLFGCDAEREHEGRCEPLRVWKCITGSLTILIIGARHRRTRPRMAARTFGDAVLGSTKTPSRATDCRRKKHTVSGHGYYEVATDVAESSPTA